MLKTQRKDMEKFITKHTPGPWTHKEYACGILKSKDEDTGTEWEHTAFRIRHGDDMGKIIGEASYSTANVGNGWVNRYEEAEANAKLIAAAPLLLSALIKYVEDEEYHMLGGAPAPSWYHEAKATIAAAGVVVEESKEETI